MIHQHKLLAVGFVPKWLLIINCIVACIYFSWWFDKDHIANIYLYSLLVFGEIYHVLMALTFWYTLWPSKSNHIKQSYDESFLPSVAIFIPVAGEPFDIVEQTIKAAKKLQYTNKSIYILNDSYVAKKENWKDYEELAKEFNVACITRKKPGGAKAGNINNALKQTTEDIIVIFDSDMVPFPDFLHYIIPYFKDSNIAYVQTPQYYKNYSDNEITEGAWEQQEFFFGPIMKGKEKSNAAFICGTNVAIRRSDLEAVGGMNEENIAEDFLTSLAIHQRGKKSVYLTTVLAEGLAPIDSSSYYKQQLRWARGSLEVLFSQNPFFKSGLSLGQRIEYIASSLYYANGLIFLIDASMPVLYLFTGIQPVSTTTTSFALYFIPFMFLNLLTLSLSSVGKMSFRAISFSQSSFTLQLVALFSILTGKQMGFAVTSKKGVKTNHLPIVLPHISYVILSIVAASVGLSREGLNPSIVTNIAWALFNCLLFTPFILAAFPKRKYEHSAHIVFAS